MSNLCDRILRLSGRAGGVLGLAHGSREGLSGGGGGSLCHPANVSMMYFPCPAFDPSRKKEKKKKKHGVRVPALPNKREEIPG